MNHPHLKRLAGSVRPYLKWGKSCTPGGRSDPKFAPLTFYGWKTLTPRSSESGFHRNVKFATFEEAGRLCKTIPQNGVKYAPWGQERPKICPIDFLWCRTAPWNGPSYTKENAFQLNITLDHSVIETRGQAHLTQNDQSASQDHCEAIKPRP